MSIDTEKGKHLGSLEIIHNIDSITHKFDKNSDGFLLLMRENLAIKEFKKADKIFHYDISQKFVQKDFVQDAKNIDIEALFKTGYFIGKKFYFTYKYVRDFKQNIVGIYLLGKNLQVVHKTVESKKELITVALIISFIMLLVMVIVSNIGLQLLVLKPLSKLDKGLTSFFHFLQKKSHSVERIDITTQDEFGEMAHSINANIEVSKQLHEEISQLNKNLEAKVQERTKELQTQQETFSAIYNGSKDSIAILDMESRFLHVNPAYVEMTGYSEEELLHTTCIALTHEEHIAASKKAMKEVMKTGYIKNFEKYCRVKDGKFLIVNMSMSLLQNPQRILISVRDVTDLKAIEKAKSEFLSNMSHEIRTPLNAILGFVGILKKRIKDEEALEYLRIIDSSGVSLLTIINDILDFSKIQNGQFTIEKYALKCKEEFYTMVDLFRANAEAKGIDYSVFISNNVPDMIEADGVRVKQIFANLLSNAIKFTPKNGKITIALFYEAPNLILSVEDSGIGISQENQKKIFLAFKQADNSTTRKYGGTGLGLSISSSLATLMGGTLYVKSQEGKGATFRLSFPVEMVEEQSVVSASKDVQTEKEVRYKGIILVAEDNKTNQMLIKLLLSDFGLEYKIANDGEEAVLMYQKAKYDLILMDENMPRLNGIEAMHKIKAYEKKNGLDAVPIIALTANALETDRQRFLDAGMDDFIAKPIDTDVLQRVLANYL